MIREEDAVVEHVGKDGIGLEFDLVLTLQRKNEVNPSLPLFPGEGRIGDLIVSISFRWRTRDLIRRACQSQAVPFPGRPYRPVCC